MAFFHHSVETRTNLAKNHYKIWNHGAMFQYGTFDDPIKSIAPPTAVTREALAVELSDATTSAHG